MAKVKIEAYVEEKDFVNNQGENVKFLSLEIPVTDTVFKSVKCEQFVLQLARDRANQKASNPFSK